MGFRRKKGRKRSGVDVADPDCCCIVDEVFGGPDCFVATASYGHPDAEPVQILRRFRDEVLVEHNSGRVFTKCYYRLGPYGARFLRSHSWLKAPTRLALMPVVRLAKKTLK